MINRIDKTQHNPETSNTTPASKPNQHSKHWNASSLQPVDAYDLDMSVQYKNTRQLGPQSANSCSCSCNNSCCCTNTDCACGQTQPPCNDTDHRCGNGN